MEWLIATDLDGTLLDDSYDLRAAASALDGQMEQGHEVVLASSKTLVEMRALAALCRRPPTLIFENGAGIAWPERLWRKGDAGFVEHGFRIQLQGEGYARLRTMLRALRRRDGLRFLGFADMTSGEVAGLTGLDPASAARAQMRQASEPIRWLDTPEALGCFRRALDQRGYRLVEGGRFLHVMPRADKGCAVGRVRRRVAELHGVTVRVLGCGDSANDLGMLSRADAALIFPGRDGRPLRLETLSPVGEARHGRRIFYAPAAGSGPWARAVSAALGQAGADAVLGTASAPAPGTEKP